MPLRFSIRDLLWLTALIGMGVGWWVDRRSYSVPPRFQLSDVKFSFGERTILTDNQTGERWLKSSGSGVTAWNPTSIKMPPANGK